MFYGLTVLRSTVKHSPPHDYEGIRTSLRGSSAITFTNTGGILFTYPIMHKDNVRNILYELCASSTFSVKYNYMIFNGKSVNTIVTRDGNIVVPFDGVPDDMRAFYNSKSVQSVFTDLNRSLDLSPAAASLLNTTHGKKFFYCARVEETDFVLAGVVDQNVAYGNLIGLPSLILVVFWILTFFVLILAMFLVMMTGKVHDSDELRRAKQIAEEASHAKSAFLANMSHEIRTPITAILDLDEMILREYRDPALRRYATDIRNSGSTLLSLINDILDFSRIEADKIVLEPDEYHLGDMVADLVSMIHPRAAQNSLDLNIYVDENTPDLLYGDNIRLKQIILNLLTNAVKYTPKGHIDFSVNYEKAGIEEIMLSVAVADTGIGIKEDDLKRLFVAFERFDEKRNRSIEGTGLGMNIVKQLLDMMDSELLVESEYGAGSIFHFTVRQKVIDWTPVGRHSFIPVDEQMSVADEYTTYFTAKNASVLLVDDTEMNLMVISGLLKSTGLAIDTASGGEEALEMTYQKKYDVLLIDHRMPGMDGVELLTRLRKDKENPNTKSICIALTANAMSGAKERYLSAGFDDYLTKPVESIKLEKLLADLLPKDKVTLTDNSFADAADRALKLTENAKPFIAEGTPSNDNTAKKDSLADNADKPDSSEACTNAHNSSEDGASSPLKQLEDQGLIDSEEGLGYAGSMDRYVMALQFFRNSIDDKAGEIEGYYDEENWGDYQTKVHGLKSTAKMIGAMKLSEKARLLELAADKKDLDYIHENHKEALDLYRSYNDLLKDI